MTLFCKGNSTSADVKADIKAGENIISIVKPDRYIFSPITGEFRSIYDVSLIHNSVIV